VAKSVIQPKGSEQTTPRTGTHVYEFQRSATPTQNITFPLSEYGYVADGKEVPPAYLVKVTSLRNKATIVSPLQEDIMLKVESNWSPLVPSSLLSDANLLFQAISGSRASVATKAASRRMWVGSTPMRLSLKMRFEAVFDSLTEVLQPLKVLGSLALPVELSVGKRNVLFLGPPGPSPFKLPTQKTDRGARLKEVESDVNSFQGGDQILIEVGEFLTFQSVIIREVNLAVPSRFDSSGNPISAEVDLMFETYEMMTAESFRGSFKNRSVIGN